MLVLFLTVLVLIFAAGYTTLSGNICAVAAVKELVLLRRAHRFVGFFFCAACSLLAIAATKVAGLDMIERCRGFPISGLAAFGGAVFGLGAFVNGRCAVGTIARLGAGDTPRIATLAAFVGGAVITMPTMSAAHPVVSPLSTLPDPVLLAVAALVAVALFLVLRFVLRDANESTGWSPLVSMSVIGAINGVLIVLAQGWPYTNLLIDIAGGTGMDFVRRGAMATAFLVGAIVGAASSGLFKPHLGSLLDWSRAGAGGFVMGAGATLIPGGNDTLLLVGLPFLLPNMMLAYATMNLTLIVLTLITASATRRQAVANAEARLPDPTG